MTELYGNGTNLPEIHPDPTTNRDVLIQALCAKLDTARQALGRALELDLASPKGQACKAHIRWALDETSPQTIS